MRIAVFKYAGLFTLYSHASWAFHLAIPRPRYWQWGFRDEQFVRTFGLGPLLLIAY